jgi:uncharacterized protein with GYD domain
MPTYFILINWTDQGIRNIKDSPKRVDAAKKAVKDIGGDVKAFYMLQGSYDAVLILEATTLRAHPEAEYRKIIGELG